MERQGAPGVQKGTNTAAARELIIADSVCAGQALLWQCLPLATDAVQADAGQSNAYQRCIGEGAWHEVLTQRAQTHLSGLLSLP